MKHWITLVAGLCLLLLACCQSAAGKGQAAVDRTWIQSANLDGREAPAALYRLALEEDVLRIYSNSTRLLDVKKTFEAQYPGLVVDIVDIRGSDMLGILLQAHAAGEYVCDLMVCADNNGVISREMIPKGALVKYVPWDIAEKIRPINNQDDLVFFNEALVLFYNGERYQEPPLDNWWELTEPRFRGKVYLSSPQKSLSTYAFLSMLIHNGEQMARSYEAHYGEPLVGVENAGEEFIRRLVRNEVVFVNSNDEIAQAVGATGQADPPVGIMVSSKVRMNDIGYRLTPHYRMEPFAGTHSTNSIMMVSGARNTNAAKLFVRWLLGETDGGGEGYAPYLQLGEWSARTDVDSREPVAMESLRLLFLDKDYVYENQEAFEAFWLLALEETNP